MPHDTRRWLKAAQAELGELLAVAEGGDSMAAEEFGYIIDVGSIPKPLLGDAAAYNAYMDKVITTTARNDQVILKRRNIYLRQITNQMMRPQSQFKFGV